MDVEVSNLLTSYAETEQAAYAEETSANNAGESDSSPSIKTLKSMLTDFNDNIALAGDEDTKLELMDQLSYVKDSLSLFSKEETIGMDVEVSHLLASYAETEQAAYVEKGRSETNVIDSILDELESNIEEGTKEEMEDLKDELYYVEKINSVNSNTDRVKRIDGMIKKIETGLNEGEESFNEGGEGFNEVDMNVNEILKVLSDRGIPQSKIDKVGFVLNNKDGV